MNFYPRLALGGVRGGKEDLTQPLNMGFDMKVGVGG